MASTGHLATSDPRAPALTAPRKRNVRNPISEDEYRRLVSNKRWLINVCDRPHIAVHRTYGVYRIPAVAEGQRYSALEVTGRLEYTDEGNDNSLQWKHEAEEIAADIVREVNSNMRGVAPERQFMGVFVCESPTPSERELASAEKRLRTMQQDLVKNARTLWDDPKTHREINELHRWAGAALNVQDPWMLEIQEKAECPSCHKPVRQDVVKCPHCQAVLDMEGMKKFFPREYAEIVKLTGADSGEPAAAKPANGRASSRSRKREKEETAAD